MAPRKSKKKQSKKPLILILTTMMIALSAGYLLRAYSPVAIPLPKTRDHSEQYVMDLERRLKSAEAEINRLNFQVNNLDQEQSKTEQELAEMKIKSMLRDEK